MVDGYSDRDDISAVHVVRALRDGTTDRRRCEISGSFLWYQECDGMVLVYVTDKAKRKTTKT